MKTIKNTTLLIILLFAIQIEMNAQNWQWAKHCGGVNDDGIGAMCTDPNGNIYAVGAFMFPQGFFDSYTLTTNGFMDAFIVKMNSNGDFIWAKSAGGYGTMDQEKGRDIFYESSTNTIIITGTMNSSGETIGTCNLGSGNNIFLSKLDLNGNCIWSVTEPISNASYSRAITVDNIGNIYMNGKYSQPGTFNGGFLQKGSFIAKFNTTNGVCEWVKNVLDINGSFFSLSYQNNNLYMGGITYNTPVVDTLNLDTAIAFCYKDDVFLSKWDTAGNVLWVKTMGGPNTEGGGYIGMDADDNTYLAGSFKDTAYFGSDTLSDGLHTNGFLTKYTSGGNIVWAKQIHATGSFYTQDVSTDVDGNTYIIGAFTDTASFDAYAIYAATTTMYVARYDSSGVCLGVKTVAAVSPGNVLTSSTAGCYVSGSFNSTANFDANTITTYGSYDGFIANTDLITGMEHRMVNSINNGTLIIYANPNKGTCNIKVPEDLLHEQNLALKIYDVKGKLIQQQPVQVEQEKVKINIQAEATGVYNVTLGNKNKMYSGKIVFE